MTEGRAPKKAASKAAKKVAPRTKGTPAKPPAPRKVAKAAAPKAAPKKAATPKAAVKQEAVAPTTPLAPTAPRPPPQDATWAPATVWTPVPAPRTQARQWTPVAGPATAPAPALPAFDPVSGDWLPVAAPVAVEVDPAAYLRGATRSILSNILLSVTLGIAGVFLLISVVVGVILFAAPDSAWGEYLTEQLEGGGSSPGFIILNALVTFAMFGVVPFIWVLGTRVIPWRGTVKFLQLRVRWKDWLLGVGLVPLMFIALFVVLIPYTCIVDGCDALSAEAEEEPVDEESPLDDMLDNLNWWVVIIVPLCAGIGEEILFRGVLQRWIGVWGQAAAFGLAHAGNAYPPQVIFAFALGVAFGYLFKRGWSLVSLIVAHTLYDFILLALYHTYPELG